MTKAGRLAVSTSIVASAANLFLTRNQVNLTSTTIPAAEQLAADVTDVNLRAQIAWTGDVSVVDVIRRCSSVNPTSSTSNNIILAFQEQEVAVSVTNTLPQFSESDSCVRVIGANGFGSTNTSSRRFSSVDLNIGSDIEYLDSATLGSSFTIKSAGIYTMSYSETTSVNGTQSTIAIAKNTTTIGALSSNILALGNDRFNTNSAIERYPTASCSVFLNVGDVIRPLADSATVNGSSGSSFSITKVGKPNVTGVDVTPFVQIPQPDTSSVRYTSNATAFGGTDNKIIYFDTQTANINNGAFSIVNTAANGTVITMLKAGKLALSASLTFTGVAGYGFIAKNITGAQLTDTSASGDFNLASSYTAATSNSVQSMAWEGNVQVGDTFRVKVITATAPNGFSSFNASFTGTSNQILTAPETFSTDTASLQYASSAQYTLSTLANAPVGTFITYTYAINSNTITQTTVAPTQTTADMNVNGIRLFTRAYNAASTASNPARIQIQIGKGLKGTSLELYKSTGKVTSGATTTTYVEGSIQYGPRMTSYDAVTGVLTLDAGYNATNITTHLFEFTDLSTQNNGYFVINASKNPALTGLGLGTVAARGVNSAGSSIGNGSGYVAVVYDTTKTYDTHSALTTSTGLYTAPEAGYYLVAWNLMFSDSTYAVGNLVASKLQKNGSDYCFGLFYETESAVNQQIATSGTTGVYLAKGDTLQVFVFNNRTAGNTTLSTTVTGGNTFSVHKTGVF